MEENTPLTVLIPVAGKEATVTFTPKGTDWDRLAIAWCILAIPAINVGKNKVASPDRYLAKTIERLPDDPEELRPKANVWAAQVRTKEHNKLVLHATLRMLLGNQVQAGLLWVDFPEGAVSAEVRRTAQLLLDHPTEHPSALCATCSAIRHYDWPLAIRLSCGRDAPIILGALMELYRSAAHIGLVPIVYAPDDGIDRRGDAKAVSPYKEEDIF